MTPPPGPGVYTVSAEVYHAYDCASRTLLSHLADERHYTPQDARHAQLAEAPDRDAQALGTALHIATMEPETYADRVTLGPINPSTKRTYGRDTQKWTVWQAEHPGVVGLTTDQDEKVFPMTLALRECPEAAAIFAKSERREVSIVANLDLPALAAEHGVAFDCDPEDSHLLVKSRLDLVAPKVATIADLKTTKARTLWEIKDAMCKCGYVHQACLYPAVAKAAGLMKQTDHFAFIFVRNEPPFRAGVFRCTEESQRIGWQELLPAMALAARCYRTEEWPGWRAGVVPIGLPDWKIRQMED